MPVVVASMQIRQLLYTLLLIQTIRAFSHPACNLTIPVQSMLLCRVRLHACVFVASCCAVLLCAMPDCMGLWQMLCRMLCCLPEGAWLQVGASMNMAIGAAAPSTAVANLLGSLAVLLSILFGGFLLSSTQMPSVVSWMAQLSFVR